MRIDILTIFPTLINSFVTESLIGKAQESGTLEISALDLREGASGAHKAVDDTPFGGGPGMVLKPEPIFNIVEPKILHAPCTSSAQQASLLTTQKQKNFQN